MDAQERRIWKLIYGILMIAVRCMKYEDDEVPRAERIALKDLAPLPLLDNVWSMMVCGNLVESVCGGFPRITLAGLEWLEEHRHLLADE